MSILTKKVDPSAAPFSESVSYDSTEFDQGDFIDVVRSMRRPGSVLRIETDSDASITVRVNSLQRRYGLNTYAEKKFIPMPDLDSEASYTTTRAPSFTAENGETIEIDDLTVSNVEVVSLTKGSGTGVSIKVR